MSFNIQFQIVERIVINIKVNISSGLSMILVQITELLIMLENYICWLVGTESFHNGVILHLKEKQGWWRKNLRWKSWHITHFGASWII